MNNQTPFEAFLSTQNEEAWAATLTTLLPRIHEVDQNGTQIWFAFYPLRLFRALADAKDEGQLAKQMLLQGHYYLKDQIDTSHQFFYGHRYWPEVKKAVEGHAEEWHRLQPEAAESSQTEVCATLADQILEVARRVASQLGVPEALLVGITAVAFMTVQQAGTEAFKAAPGTISIDPRMGKKSPEQVLRDRSRNDSQGLFGFLRTVNKQWTVTFDENDEGAKYKLRDGQDLAWGAADDRSRDWKAIDPRRIEGPIPVECRSASCGTCWVGVLCGAERLARVGAREAKKIKEFGYIDTSEPKPVIRLACQAQAHGAVSIVIPPWNGQFGKYLRQKSENEAVEEETLDGRD